jgi:hypothetical protein
MTPDKPTKEMALRSTTTGRPVAAPVPARPDARQEREPGDVNWFRFWMQVLLAVVVFNVLAALVAWFFILPQLHPAR